MKSTSRYISVCCVCSLLILVHISSIIILLKTKKLRNTRFYRLALFLSISDAFFLLFYMLYSIVKNNNDNSLGYLNTCLILVHMVAGTVLFSLVQTSFICLERLNATFTTPNRKLNLITSNASVGVSFLATQAYALIRGVVDVSSGPQPCTTENTVRKNILLYYDVPMNLLSIFIGLCSILVIVRIFRHQKVNPIYGTEQQAEQWTAARQRMRKNLITLGCVVVTTFLSVIPRVIYGSYIQLSGEMNSNKVTIMVWMNILLLLNPIVDPFVYILRISEFRSIILLKIFRRKTTNETTITVSSSNATHTNMSD